MRTWVATAAVLAFVSLAPAAGAATDTPCVGTLPPGTYENVVVPPGASCTLEGSVVEGNVKAFEGSRLTMLGNDVRGNVEAWRAIQVGIGCPSFPGGPCPGAPNVVAGNVELREIGIPPMPATIGTESVRLCGNAVGGDILVVDGRAGNVEVGTSGFTACTGNTVGGDVIVQGNPQGSGTRVGNNVVGGNILLLENDVGAGPMPGLIVSNNRLGGDLQVKENRSAHIVIGTNQVGSGNLQVAKNSVATVQAVGNSVGRNLQYSENVAQENNISGNQVAQNLQFFRNVATTLNRVQFNRIGDTLSCSENVPPPLFGGNFAQRYEGECPA
jgi:hypothetical protein